MKGSCSSSFKSRRKFLYLNLLFGESRFKSYRGNIYYKFDLGVGVLNTDYCTKGCFDGTKEKGSSVNFSSVGLGFGE